MVEGGLVALVVCLSRRAELVHARLAARAPASFEGVGDTSPAPRTRDPAPAGWAADADSGGSCAAGSAEPLAATGVVGELSGEAGHLVALAPPTRRPSLDSLRQEARQAAAQTVAARHDPPARPRKSGLGPPTHRRRLRGVGVTVSATSVRKVLFEGGLKPSPGRTRSSWREFLLAQAASMLACDFLSAPRGAV